jgi:hypothetical protein
MTYILHRAAAPAGRLTASTNSTPTCDSPKCRNRGASWLSIRCSLEAGEPLRGSMRSRNDQRSGHQSNRPGSPINGASTCAISSPRNIALKSANDEVERRGASLASNEGTLSQSSTPSLAHRKRDPRDRSNRLLGDLPKRALVQIGVSIGPAWPSMKDDNHAINDCLFEIFTPSNIIGIVL